MPRREGPPVPMPQPGHPDFWAALEAHSADWAWRRHMSDGQWARRRHEQLHRAVQEQCELIDQQVTQPALPW